MVGSAVVVASGLFLLWRETAARQLVADRHASSARKFSIPPASTARAIVNDAWELMARS